MFFERCIQLSVKESPTLENRLRIAYQISSEAFSLSKTIPTFTKKAFSLSKTIPTFTKKLKITVSKMKECGKILKPLFELYCTVNLHEKRNKALCYENIRTKFDNFQYHETTIFSRRFMKWNATIIATLFQSTRTDRNSSSEVLRNMVSNWTIWPSELNQKGFSFFSRNIPYRARLKGPPSSFFGMVGLFSIFSPKSPPPLQISQRAHPWSFFRHCEIFSKIF